ncbi:hypothetical protein ACFQL1_08500 [Halomicroarcula sp. GCM10025709]|uniref:hypothetical protein n=1 Tax=Haloarcula TaxID=2237 RepID=UPI0024C3DA01|nr:hypothetical protein [Halomicroarcula sp. YJ-61-S]
MRHIPDPDAGGPGLRPVVAVALGIALLTVAVAVVVTGGGSVADESNVSVTATATPVETLPANATVHRHASFELATPVHRAVTRAGEHNAEASTTATVEDIETVRLPEDADRTTYYVRSDRSTDPDEELFQVTVERTGS